MRLNKILQKEMIRKKIVAGNWKMNKTMSEARSLVEEIKKHNLPDNVTVVLCPPSLYADAINQLINGVKNLHLGAQNVHQETSGAYTGEVSIDMLKSVGVEFVIIGHSERRASSRESSAHITQKIKSLSAAGVTPIYCCGEPLAIREKGTHVSYVAKQIRNELFGFSGDEIKNLVIAYEPIWAIGTGKTASSDQAQEMHAALRNVFAKKYGKEIAEGISILYGGSCNAANAKEIFGKPDVDGGLIGGASLKAKDFVTIVQSF